LRSFALEELAQDGRGISRAARSPDEFLMPFGGAHPRPLRSLERWRATDPHAPEGNWYKDFGSFLFCGTSELPKTILAKGMRPYGQEID